MGASLANDAIPVIDLFAGPGGLGEGFSSLREGIARNGPANFRICLSIEKDRAAWRTLWLRAFFRYFHAEGLRVPESYYDHLRQQMTVGELRQRHPQAADAADAEAWNIELGAETPGPHAVKERITSALRDAGAGAGAGAARTRKPWVLIGGPPCQAFSIVGRSRNKTKAGYTLKGDPRQRLYLEYLQVIADHWPDVFVMENVKGMLSAQIEGKSVFSQILEDLSDPQRVVGSRRVSDSRGYTVFSLTVSTESPVWDPAGVTSSLEPRDYVVHSERIGLPQARHRVILVGVRSDLGSTDVPRLPAVNSRTTVEQVIERLPRLRSGVSGQPDSAVEWQAILKEQLQARWVVQTAAAEAREVIGLVRNTLSGLRLPRADRGNEFIECDAPTDYEPRWFADGRLGGIANHYTRSHMPSDLARYLFASCFTHVHQRSPDLAEFPVQLLPDHANVAQAIVGQKFGDRFRVQARCRPATTVVSHIAKDGHYYIHYDPTQCRSFTVREAARVQTFPDNYLFVGNRTEQYTQVGNAVPPLLAHKIAGIVHSVLDAVGAIR